MNKWLRFIPALAWMGVIFALSSRTGDEINSVLPFFQKFFPGMTDFNWGHFVSYFILAAAFDYGFGRRADGIVLKLAIILLCGLYGVTDELHQSYVGGRMMDMKDIRNDMIGAAVWTIVISIPFVRKKWRRYAS
ncbi:VanZ family protein [Paenibacillus soyae]|uniref:VanZ family protein n=1 Tax=Paenibacillus soyae TaxID=2969249 RepID=A0A9X2SAR0_9BACL|nr:VanZ family protein [Paenibacillus soyae]MCR2804878.1 VanZ family protein [Paenibacillus soyae]